MTRFPVLQAIDSKKPCVDCSSLPPRGAETLPRGIVVPMTDLYPRRLWGKPEEVCPFLKFISKII